MAYFPPARFPSTSTITTTAITAISALSLHDALPISESAGHGSGRGARAAAREARDLFVGQAQADRKSTRLNSSHVAISYAVFCLKKKNREIIIHRSVSPLL